MFLFVSFIYMKQMLHAHPPDTHNFWWVNNLVLCYLQHLETKILVGRGVFIKILKISFHDFFVLYVISNFFLPDFSAVFFFLLIISPNEVFGDIMVLASLLPPVDPDDINSKNIQRFSFKFYMRIVWLLSNFIQRWSIWSYIKKIVND